MSVNSPILPDRLLRLMDPKDRVELGKGGRTAAETLARAEVRSEKILQEQICSLLRRREIVYIRPAMFRKSQLPPGWPDFSFCYRSIAVGLECKSEIGQPTGAQLQMHAHMTANGWEVHVVRSLAEVIQILNEIDERDQKPI
jgi:hypothetical protein